MNGVDGSGRGLDRLVLLLLLALFPLLEPVRHWWASGALPWYTPYLGWAVIVLLIPLTKPRGGDGI